MKDQRKMNAPHFKIQCCRECGRRKVGCHTDCRLYQGYVREGQRMRKIVYVGNSIKDLNYQTKGRR